MSSLKEELPIIVVGGGLGGVATALALGQQGRQVRLLEQSDEIAPIGYGVQIGPNVLPALKRLGIDRSRFIICAADLTPEQASGLSAMYELNFVNLPMLAPHLAQLG